MKKLLVVAALIAFVVAGLVTLTYQTAETQEAKINCCVKGKCSQVTKAECDKAGGKVVKDCKECK